MIHHTYTKANVPLQKSKLLEQYKKIRNETVNIIRLNKKYHYETHFAKHNKDLRKIWIGMKQIININANNSETPTCIGYNGVGISEPK